MNLALSDPVAGALLGPAIAGVLFTPVILYATLRQTGVAFSAGLSWQLLKFSAPLVPAALAMFIVHFSDRYILREFGTLEAVGLYAVAYKFGMLVSTLVGQPFSLIWGNRLHSYYWHENRDALYNETLSGLTFALCLVALGISLFIEPVLALMTPEQRSLEEASADLGAGPVATFFLVVLPQIRPGIVTGSIFAFISSWINVELSIFNATADLTTIPVKLFNYVQYTIDPTVAAVSAATILAAVAAIAVLDMAIGLDVLSERD